MAAEAFNSLGGYSVGIPPTSVINENGAASFSSISVSGFSALGSVGNVKIFGGENGYFLQTDGTGNLTWTAGTGNGGNGSPGGSNSQVQFNDAGDFGGDAGFTYDKINNVLAVTGNIVSYNYSSSGNIYADGKITANGDVTSNANVTGNYFIGNGYYITGVVSTEANYAAYAGNVTLPNQPNITSLGNLVSLTVTGNIRSGNANLGNATISNYFVGNGSLLTGIAKATSADAVANGSSNVNIPLINGNITMAVGGNPNVMVVTTTGVVSRNLNITGTSAFSNIIITQKFNSNQAANVNLGSISNLHIDGGLNGYFLQTDGQGNLNWAAAGGGGGNGSPGGSNTQIQYNDNGLFNGSSSFTFNENSNIVTIANLTVSQLSNLGEVANITIMGGGSGYLLTTDGNGLLQWSPPGSGSAISNGSSNLNISVYDGNITAAVNGISDVLTITETGLAVTGNITGNNITASENLIANTFQMGTGIYEFYHSSVYFATTSTGDPDQVLWSIEAANLSSIDFTIISTDETSNARQTAKISAAVLGTEVVFNEYSGLYINGGVGSFSVIYQAGSPDNVQLIVTPDTSNLIKYNMMIIQYAN